MIRGHVVPYAALMHGAEAFFLLRFQNDPDGAVPQTLRHVEEVVGCSKPLTALQDCSEQKARVDMWKAQPGGACALLGGWVTTARLPPSAGAGMTTPCEPHDTDGCRLERCWRLLRNPPSRRCILPSSLHLAGLAIGWSQHLWGVLPCAHTWPRIVRR